MQVIEECLRIGCMAVETRTAVHVRRFVNHFEGPRLGLRFARAPQAGKLVDLQAFDRGRWRTFATARARGPPKPLDDDRGTFG